ncbi:polysulfide reductase NrfD, partial [bacterium]|nr:polysulfide reductase NrfD [bacterium]
MSENTATNSRLIATKAALWCLVGAAAVVVGVRYALGLGLTTALTDTTPWGMWIGFDVLSGVALAAGGFVLAAAVHIFGRERYHGIVRPAILTAFLGYLGVIIGLLVDLGRPWNIWRPVFQQNLHSPLFEVAMCVMLYTTVLALEFAPTALERWRRAQPVVRLLRRLVLPLVITGICLSTLHQSSLGTMFLLTEGRMHPLWYSPLQSPLFLISAVALGLGMVTLEGVVSAWLYRRKAEWQLFGGLTRAAAVVLGLYLVVRLVDLGVRGMLGHAVDGSGFAVLFWLELALSAVLPILLFTLPQSRGQPWAHGWGALLVVAGFVLHRADVGGISHVAITGEAYVPALTEVVTSLGIVAGLALVFLFCVERLRIWEEPPAA